MTPGQSSLKTIASVIALSLGLLAAPVAADAQPPGKVARIGILSTTSRASGAMRVAIDPFCQGLRDLGYVEGKNIVIEYRWAEGRPERLPELTAELVRLKMDVIVALDPGAARTAKNATKTIPVVFTGSGDPVAEGLVASLARPGGNLTGLSIVAGLEIVGKRMELLKEAVPGVTRMAMLWNPTNPSHGPVLKEIPGFARSLGVALQPLEARGPDDFEGAFAAMSRNHVGGVVVLSDAIFSLHGTRLAELAAQSRLPAIYGNRVVVEAGGLMSYQGNFADMYKRVPTFVDKILKGAKPGDLPIEQPTKFELVINLKTAKALGLTIPDSVLIRADEVIR